jgi:hypothetical protein
MPKELRRRTAGDGFLDGLTGDQSVCDKEQQLIEHERISGSAVPR